MAIDSDSPSLSLFHTHAHAHAHVSPPVMRKVELTRDAGVLPLRETRARSCAKAGRLHAIWVYVSHPFQSTTLHERGVDVVMRVGIS